MMQDSLHHLRHNETVENNENINKISHHLLNAYIPVIVFLFVLAIVGICGNITSAFYFGNKKKKTSTELFITILAVVDLVVCFLIFLYVAQLFVNISVYTNHFFCKASYFIYHWGILLSVSILCAIAVDRYKKICRPFKKQFTSNTAIRIFITLLVTSGIISSRDFWTYDSFAVNVTISGLTAKGRICMNTRKDSLKIFVTASHIIDVIIVTVIFLILVATYVNIIRSLYKHKKKMAGILHTPSAKERKQRSSSPSGSTVPINNAGKHPTTSSGGSQRSSFQFTQMISKSERSTTLMMLTVSVGLLVCFVPYFIATLIKLKGTKVEYELSAWYRFAISSVLANSVINPIIYFVFNPMYRQYLLTKVLRCVRSDSYRIESPRTSVDGTN